MTISSTAFVVREALGGDIRARRVAAGLRLRDLAASAGVHLTSLKKWERGLEAPPTAALRRLADVLGVGWRELLYAQKCLTAEAVPGEGYTTATQIQRLRLERRAPLSSGKLRVLDLFCGAGGFSYGFERSGTCEVGAGIDLLPDRIATFYRNHLHARAIADDIREYAIDKMGEDAGNPDIVIGGPPCQGFSSIRPFRTLTEADRRNTLAEHFLLVLRTLRPRWFVFENVVGLLTHAGGGVFRQLMESFVGLGYRVDWRVVNAANFGVPQDRERIFAVGSAKGAVFEWPKPTHHSARRTMAGNGAPSLAPMPLIDGPVRPAVTVLEAIHDLPALRAGESASHYREDVVPTPYELRMRDAGRTVTLHHATAHSKKMLEIIRHAGLSTAALPRGMITSGFSSCYSRLEGDKPSTTITVNFVHPSSNRCIHPSQDRALTPREGARLQSFPDSFEFVGTRAQVVKQIGNAVPPLLGELLAGAISSQS